MGHTEVGEYGAAALQALRRGRVPAVRRDARRADRVDEPPRCRGRGARGLRGDGLDRRVPRGRRWSAPSGGCTRRSSTPKCGTPQCGDELLQNFLFGICGLEPSWTMDSIIDDAVDSRSARRWATTA